MSRELVQKYPDIYQYTGIWMEDITHTTARGSTPFTLSSTNKLLKQYQWATGAENRFNGEGEILSVCNCQKRWDRPDYGRDDCTGFQGTFSGAATLLSYGYSVSACTGTIIKTSFFQFP